MSLSISSTLSTPHKRLHMVFLLSGAEVRWLVSSVIMQGEDSINSGSQDVLILLFMGKR